MWSGATVKSTRAGRPHRERSDRDEAAGTARACMYDRREDVGGLSPPIRTPSTASLACTCQRARRMMAHAYGHDHRSPPRHQLRCRASELGLQ
eukprot:3872837-Prymnesium_polylepis.1